MQSNERSAKKRKVTFEIDDDSEKCVNETISSYIHDDNSISNEISPQQVNITESNKVHVVDNEEEEIFVYAMFPAYDGYDFIKKSPKIDIDINALFSATPTCTMRGCDFIGRHEMALGTKMFFAAGDASNSANEQVAYNVVGLANKVINYNILTAHVDADKVTWLTQMPVDVIPTVYHDNENIDEIQVVGEREGIDQSDSLEQISEASS